MKETPGYLSYQGEQLYYMHFKPDTPPKARVILAGPFVSERPHTYTSWLRWARFLALNEYETILFDYRGTGESTGHFEIITFDMWYDDLVFFAKWIVNQTDDIPLVLHGIGIGGLLSSLAFNKGFGDGLLLWSPTRSCRQMLYQMLRNRCVSDLMLAPEAPRKTRKDYINDLETNINVEVEGFNWSKKLWASSKNYNLDTSNFKIIPKKRSWLHIDLDNTVGSLNLNNIGNVPNPIIRAKLTELSPCLDKLFETNLKWINDNISSI